MYRRCQVYAYVHVDGELTVTMTRTIVVPCVPFVGMVLNGNQASLTVDSVAYNYVDGLFCLMTGPDDCEVDAVDGRVMELNDDGFRVAIDYRKSGESQTKGRNDGEA